MVRTKRFFVVLAFSAGIATALAIGTVLLVVFSAIAFSGSTGSAHQAFLNGLAPVGRFVLGALVTGCGVAMVNSVATSEGFWVWPIGVLALFGGIAVAISPPVEALLSSAAGFFIHLVAGILITK